MSLAKHDKKKESKQKQNGETQTPFNGPFLQTRQLYLANKQFRVKKKGENSKKVVSGDLSLLRASQKGCSQRKRQSHLYF
ncbi:CLUMA_CG013595, isoform A [Clunio marinus]|uniref:CLUMA_CG013595, isoform A n=1 Tax=Clunio marinus TaxID=568069 RepID=A0A1J1IKN3_9DIPT|nr:CLUMA_CG013595, isoform A [Clunio marinus]